MAVAVSRDLTVQVLEDGNVAKLVSRQQALRTAIQKGEPKCLGVTQVMLGLMVMSYSIPLHFTEVTEVVSLGVPWWSGLTVSVCIHCVLFVFPQLSLCLMISVVAAVLSIVAAIIYSVDMYRNHGEPCEKTLNNCSDQYYAIVRISFFSCQNASRLSRGVKSSLFLFTLTQTTISAILCILLLKHRHSFGQYAVRLCLLIRLHYSDIECTTVYSFNTNTCPRTAHAQCVVVTSATLK
uniref:Transmembrane protein 176 n=1 Tax=Mola mola TaxID=94237 RepID=A0A3Q3WN64_MOLML